MNARIRFDTAVSAEQTPPICPVCGQLCTAPPIYRYTAERAAAHFCPPERDRERNLRLRDCVARLWKGDDCLIVRCQECGFAFGYPHVGGDEEYYGILHEQHGYPGWRWDYDIAMSGAVQRRDGGRILDIGAGTGNFLAALDARWEKHATEGSDTTRVLLEAKDIKTHARLSDLVSTSSGTFNVVTMFQLLEHISEFRALLAQCRRLLRSDGALVITVPDGDAMIRQERLTGLPDMPPFHVNKWTPGSLSRVLQQVGFLPEAVTPSPRQWSNLLGAAHLRILSDASHAGSISAQVYRLKRRSMRIPFLAALAVPAALRMLPHIAELREGGAFAIVCSCR